MKQTILLTVILLALVAGLVYLGGVYLAIGLGVIGLTTVIFMAFMLGSRWTYKIMAAGAELAIRSAGQNDTHDAAKIKALADLGRELVKTKQVLTAGDAYPVLPPATAIDGVFTIAGLDEEQK